MFCVKFRKPHASCHFQMAVICSYILSVMTVVAFELPQYQFIYHCSLFKIKLKCVYVSVCICVSCVLSLAFPYIFQ